MKARYVKSRWWVAGSALGAFVALVGALFARDHAASSPAGEAVETVLPVSQSSPRSSQPSTRRVQPAQPVQPGTTTQVPHTRTRAS
jgi:hypothetical protein